MLVGLLEITVLDLSLTVSVLVLAAIWRVLRMVLTRKRGPLLTQSSIISEKAIGGNGSSPPSVSDGNGEVHDERPNNIQNILNWLGVNPCPHKCPNCPGQFPSHDALVKHQNLCLAFSNHSTHSLGEVRVSSELQEDQIRLIELQPSSDMNARLRGKMFVEKSSHRPPYTALSYAWGSDTDTDSILISNKEIEITHNLGQALRHLRAQGKLIFWADRLCLDQQNDLEMATQVKRMFAIYQLANEVVVWLGLSNIACANVVKKLNDDKMPTPGKDIQITELRHLTDREYWSRLWIIQEIAAATRLQIYCGMSILEWDRFQAFFTGLHDRLMPLPRGFARVMTIVRMRTDFKQRRPPMLEALLQTTRSRATRPRDKIYGLLGLAADSNHYVVEPNYWKEYSVTTLCLEMAERNILQLSSLDIIFLGDCHPTDLPSWCPNFVNLPDNVVTRNLVRYITAVDERRRWGRSHPKWSATGQERMSQDWAVMHDGILTVTGVYVDSINSLGGTSEELSMQHTYVKRQRSRKSEVLVSRRSLEVDMKEHLGSMLMMYHPDYQKHREAASQLIPFFLYSYDRYYDCGNFNNKATSIRTWLGHHVPSGRSDYERLARHQSADSDTISQASSKAAQWLFAMPSQPHRLSPANQDRRPVTPTPSPKTHFRHEDLDAVVDCMYAIISEGLRLMTTYEHDVGWAHPDAELDDQIWLIDGCSMPVILRRIVGSSEKLYSVVGHCYMKSRIMSGNLWQHEKKKKRQQVVRLG